MVNIPDDTPWQFALTRAIELFLNQALVGENKMLDHTASTPGRVVRAFSEMVEGYNQDPAVPLAVQFRDDFMATCLDEMIHFRNIRVVSTCAHHLVPIIGVAHFAYIPSTHVVGLSKVPRYLRILGKRLQVQERLTTQAVNLFQRVVKPVGCGISIKAVHCCMMTRGAMEHAAVTQTTALRGSFKDNPETRREFLESISKQETILG